MTESTKIDIRAETVRRLLRRASSASLATMMTTDDQPYASLVLMATDPAGQPLLLLSDLAVHSKNIARNANASILIAEAPGDRDPLTLPRISAEGVLDIVEESGLKARYLRRFPSTQDFADFTDFKLYRMNVSRAHLVAGFGDIHWLDGGKFLIDPGFLAASEAEKDIIDHMNSDHADAVQELVTAATGKPTEGWEICGIDVEGMDLRKGWQYERILFPAPTASAEEVRKGIIGLLKSARS
ncbi:DUF2470 domain-containing protein [Sneathiella sp.]|uniref:HugZ family pyridoxamine 5'-phosphate oxidase n=1 Tax=Sneathiella sp. TaxID=1964365 RepID=UPI0026041D7E|nr:DUF2470 domain-containing protein [Sneathiella sp.]MDF2367383.1 DUF2470 domain-containing protein [Sneathiella sp.]